MKNSHRIPLFLTVFALLAGCAASTASSETAASSTAPTVQAQSESAPLDATATPEIEPDIAPDTAPKSEPEIAAPVTISDSIPWAEGDLYAVFHLGYNYSDAWQQAAADTLTAWDLPAADTYTLGGDEVYLVMPRYQGTSFTLYENVMVEGDSEVIFEQGQLLQLHQTDAPFLMLCNPSDLWSNVVVQVIADDQTAIFSPSTSLMDGTLNALDCGLDMTDYDLLADMLAAQFAS